MNLTFQKKGRITLGEKEQSKNGSFFYKLGAVVDRQTETFSCSEDVFNKIPSVGEFNECVIIFVFTDSFNNPRLVISDIAPLKK